MSLQLTPFGAVFLVLGLALLLRRPAWLPAFLVIAATLHAPAVMVLSRGDEAAALGVTPWHAACGLAGLHGMMLLASRRRLELGRTPFARRLFLGWTAFTLWAVLSAFTLPYLFQGLPTYNPEHLLSLATPPEPLAWRLSNAVQAFNFAMIWCALLYLLQVANEAGFARRLLSGFIIAAALTLAMSAWQRAQTLAAWAVPAWWENSLNPSYAHTAGYGLGDWLRLNWPFSEPSYASAWFAAVYAAGLAALLFGEKPKLGAGLLALGMLGLLNTMGGSGVAGAAAATLVLIAAFVWRMLRTRRMRAPSQLVRLAVLPAMLAALAAGATLLSRHERFEGLTLRNVFDQVVVARVFDYRYPLNGLSRTSSNLKALELVRDTAGLGVGIGSNRASSYAMNLASSVGVLPALGFALLLAAAARRLLLRHASTLPAAIPLLGGQLGMLCAVTAGIPDLAWPAWWIWVLATAALAMVEVEPAESNAEEPTIP